MASQLASGDLVSDRYASALYDLAAEKKLVDPVLGDLSNLKNILKPYYTTKSKGSGLGLSIVNKIINDHNGSINFNSTKIGAKVKITLPIK